MIARKSAAASELLAEFTHLFQVLFQVLLNGAFHDRRFGLS